MYMSRPDVPNLSTDGAWSHHLLAPAERATRPQGTLSKSAHSLHSLEACDVYTKRVPTQWTGYRNCVWNCESVPNEQQQQHSFATPISSSFPALQLIFVAQLIPYWRDLAQTDWPSVAVIKPDVIRQSINQSSISQRTVANGRCCTVHSVNQALSSLSGRHMMQPPGNACDL